METSLRDEIHNRLSKYLAGQSELSEFHAWLIPAAWDMDDESEETKKLAYRLQLLLAECSNGDRSESELRESLWNLIGTTSVTVTIGEANPVNLGNVSITQQVQTGLRSVGTAHVMAPA